MLQKPRHLRWCFSACCWLVWWLPRSAIQKGSTWNHRRTREQPGAGCCKPRARGEAVGDGPDSRINLWAFKDSPFLHSHLQQPHTFPLHAAVHFLLSGKVFTWLELVPAPPQPELVPSGLWESSLTSSIRCCINGWLVFLSLPMHLERLLHLGRQSCTSVTEPTCPHMPWHSHSAGERCDIIVSTAKPPAALTPRWVSANICTPAACRAQGFAYFHTIRKQECGHYGQWERM